MIYKRRKCSVAGCNRNGRNKGKYLGKTRYDHKCEMHHKEIYPNLQNTYFYERSKVENFKCERCGWDKTHCDRHRINPNLGYTRENIIILCPNCHRLEDIKKNRQ